MLHRYAVRMDNLGILLCSMSLNNTVKTKHSNKFDRRFYIAHVILDERFW